MMKVKVKIKTSYTSQENVVDKVDAEIRQKLESIGCKWSGGGFTLVVDTGEIKEEL